MPAMTNSGRTALSPPDFWPDHCIAPKLREPPCEGWHTARGWAWLPYPQHREAQAPEPRAEGERPGELEEPDEEPARPPARLTRATPPGQRATHVKAEMLHGFLLMAMACAQDTPAV